MIKHVSNSLNRKKRLQAELLKLSSVMLQGSLVRFRRRICGKAGCHCHQAGDPGHNADYLSVPTPKGTRMVYLSKSILPQIPKRIRAFKQFWEIGKKISQTNLTLLKKSASRRKNHVRSR